MSRQQGTDNTPWLYYALAAFSYLAAMIASNHSLQFVPYPTQVINNVHFCIYTTMFLGSRQIMQTYSNNGIRCTICA